MLFQTFPSLERRYVTNFDGAFRRKWKGIQLPGIRPVYPLDANSQALSTWVPLPAAEYAINTGCQPYFKLHGSSNWRTDDAPRLLIIGGGKTKQRDRHPVLARYARAFDEYLSGPNAKLMIIGYGFRGRTHQGHDISSSQVP
jgi:hypothetical protein